MTQIIIFLFKEKIKRKSLKILINTFDWENKIDNML